MNERKIHFYNLSAKQIDKDSVYLEAIDNAIKDENVFNIAITGKYGSGKTSTIATYEKIHTEYDYLNISLASFENNGQDNNMLIERSILQQLFYRINPKVIPFSRFKRIKGSIDKLIYLKILLGILIFIDLFFSICLLKNPQFVNIEIMRKNFYDMSQIYFPNLRKGLFVFILGIFVFISIIIITCYIIKGIIYLIEVSSVKLKSEGVEIEVTSVQENKDSIFNKYLDEIIYFFEKTNYDVIVIEDLDRFKNSNDVFIKLRELNQLVNNCQTINRRIRFVYCVKDEMFENKERTKFFDFIIPIIPIINSANSRQKLLEKLEENPLEKELDNQFVKSITLYIDDMRILNNIMNEFNIYKSNLQCITNLTMENLFSIITFKNLYPKEFAELQNGKGIVCNIFNTKTERINQYINLLNAKKQEYERKIEGNKFHELYSEKLIKQILWMQIKIALRNGIRYKCIF